MANTETAPTTPREQLTERWAVVADRLIAQGRFPADETRQSFIRYWVNADLATTRREGN